ncbi:hypothetical protein [Pseudomonas vranovensis]|uniref:Cap15 family cyclic dinucleotide receptor domain-containing protein n=1 Tax=Pseudomonas vranovensis TaxID=321661 RepID=UPI003D990CA9
MPVLKADFVRPFGTVVGLITFIVAIFNKYAWSWRIFKGWYVKRPDIRGTWKVELKSSWTNPETGQTVPAIYGYAVVRQSLTSLSFRLMTEESRSVLVAHSIDQQEDDDLFKLVGVYRNEPKIELQGLRSEIHHGSFALEIHGSPAYELQGHYWTDRGTKGSIKLSSKVKKLYDTYEQAKRELGR